ncbi:MAG: glycoside hydrolase family 125 protein [Carboxylicivirga sp.]|jgi:meiotically up-regulated gene 157 (Mug157) protein|nr:glycoside hydrolase family 125 protein [Carboxylicivirga sp.]
MTSRRDFLKNLSLGVGGMMVAKSAFAGDKKSVYVTKRPSLEERNFSSPVIEKVIADTKKKIKDPKLAYMFENCFPNTLDTTVEHTINNGVPDTFVITGDIHAMWLRDSTAQVWPYLPYAKKEQKLSKLIAGVVHRQTKCILLDAYANAFNKEAVNGEFAGDHTEMKPGVHERKWEIDSLCYAVRLAYNYHKVTGNTSIFTKEWLLAAERIHDTFKEQQRKEGLGPYRFERTTPRQLDTLSNNGYGRPLKPVGLINSSFRPSDDASTLGYLIPSNLFAVVSLRQIAEICDKIVNKPELAKKCRILAEEVEEAIKTYGIKNHPEFGKVYAYEVDGYGNALFMDDANVPSLIALPYLNCVDVNDPVYQNTRKLVWSDSNPYFFKGTAAEGIGGPHVGYDMVWPMSIIMKAMTSDNLNEIGWCVRTLRDTDADTGFMHETFHKDNPKHYTRSWFAWANTLFGELMLKLVEEKKINKI